MKSTNKMAMLFAAVLWGLASSLTPFLATGAPMAAPPGEQVAAPLQQSYVASPFSTAVVVTANADGAHSVAGTDIDRDGRRDLLAASREDGQIVWHRNQGNLRFAQYLLAIAPGVYQAIPADVNGDARPDIVAVAVGVLDPSAASGADAVAPDAGVGTLFWLENNIPASLTFARHEIASGLAYPVAVHSADLDNDGDVDLIVPTRDDGRVVWYENNGAAGAPSFVPHVLTNALPGAVAVATGDLDRDGRLDVIAAGEDVNRIVWFRNEGGHPATFSGRVIRNGAVPDPTRDYAKFVQVGDMDGDGDLDIVFASEDENLVGWYENQQRGATFVEHFVGADGIHAKIATAADLDNDGDLDILAAYHDSAMVVYYENDGKRTPSFALRVVTAAAVGARSIDVADIDSDGDQDILVASRFDDKISIYVNNTIHRSAIINGERIVATYKETRSVAAADLDNDGDMDLLSTSSHIVAWHENDGDRPPRFASHTIVDNLLAGRWVDTGDLDGDGDIDVLAADRDANTIWWFENRFNQSGAVTFTPHLVVNDALGVRDVHAADIDGDGDMDVYSASDTDNTIAWYENLDGRGTSFARHNVTQTAMYARSSYAADIDGDGRLDLMSASARDDRVAWYRNTGGGVWPEYTIINTADGAQFIYAADIDSDGDADLLAVSERDNTIAWFANRLRAGRGFDHYIVSNQAAGVHAAIASDMDGDGDLDIVAAVEYSDEIIWYESSGGYTPSFTAHVISAFADVAHGVFAADLDNDGDLDVLSASRADGKIAWYENRGGQYGIREARPQVSAGGQQLMVDMILSSRGRPGDPALELRALTLRFQTKDGRRLTGAQAAELFARIAIYRDNGDGAFNPAQDALAASETTFPLNNGEMTVSLPNLPTQAAASDRYFVAVEPKNSICAAENIRISVITNRRTAADITTGFPLLAEYMRDLDASGDPNFARKPALIINELMPDNVSTLEDPQEPGEYPDWFELYNTNDLYIDLGGMYLSDDPNNLRTHRIPDGVIIPPFGYLVFIADGEPEQGPLHTSFRLSKGGEPLVLFDIDERGNQVIDVVDFDSVPADVAFGRSPADAKVWIELKTPTPGRFNLDEPPTDFVFLPAIIYPGTCN